MRTEIEEVLAVRGPAPRRLARACAHTLRARRAPRRIAHPAPSPPYPPVLAPDFPPQMLYEKIGFRFKSVYEAFNAIDQHRSGAIEDEEFRNNRASRRTRAARAGIRALFRAPSPSHREHRVRRG